MEHQSLRIQLILKEIALDDLGVSLGEVTKGYVHIKISNLFPGTVLPCDVFMLSMSRPSKDLKLERVALADSQYHQSFHKHLLEQDLDGIYIRQDQEEAFFDYFNENALKLIHSPSVPTEKKTRVLYDNAETIVEKVFREHPNRSNILTGQKFIDAFSDHLSTDSVSTEVLLSLFSKDYYTFAHSVQVALLGMAFCRFLGWSAQEVRDFGLGALFHDIGKSSIDRQILNKPSMLDKDELEIIKKHPLMGYQQLRRSQTMSKAQLTVPLHHHEAADGSGYPQGLEGSQIHRYARVARLVDCYDALTTKRAYKDAFAPARALQIMRDEMGHTFDSHLLGKFFKFLKMSDEIELAGLANRICLELGSQVALDLESSGLRLKTVFVGMESGRYVILSVPGLEQVQKQILPGRQVIARYLHAGTVYGFKTTVLGHIHAPGQLVFLAYPKSIENINLRHNPRHQCHIPIEAEIDGETVCGHALDISHGGCKILLPAYNPTAGHSALLDAVLMLRMELGQNRMPLTLKGKVRNLSVSEAQALLGIQFSDLSQECIEGINMLIPAGSSMGS